MVLRALTLFLILLASAVATAQDGEPSPDGPERLYLTDEEALQAGYNVTTFAPGANASGTAIQFISFGNDARLAWGIRKLPAAWNVTSGEESEAVLHLSGLDELFPTPPEDPADAITTLGRLRITAQILDHQQRSVIEGQVLFEPQLAEPRDEVFPITVPMTAMADSVLDPASGTSYVAIQIVISGRNMTQSNISPAHIHLGSPQTPSNVRLEGFPVEGFREWEEAERTTMEKNRDILTGGGPGRSGNATPLPTESPSPAGESPIDGAVLLTFLVAASLAVSALRKAELTHRRR